MKLIEIYYRSYIKKNTEKDKSRGKLPQFPGDATTMNCWLLQAACLSSHSLR